MAQNIHSTQLKIIDFTVETLVYALDASLVNVQMQPHSLCISIPPISSKCQSTRISLEVVMIDTIVLPNSSYLQLMGSQHSMLVFISLKRLIC